MRLPFAWEHVVGVLGVLLMAVGHYVGLALAPPEAMMGDVARILYVHVPAAWVALLCFLVAFIASIGYLIAGSARWDALLEATVEVGIVMTALLLALGSIWARPTWGVWWTWDPRLTTAAVMLLAFLGVTALRSLVDDPERRALWSSVATIIAFVDVPIVYFSVRWWRSLHQVQSTPKTVDPQMVAALRISSIAMILVTIWLVVRRWRIARRRLERELAQPEALLEEVEAL